MWEHDQARELDLAIGPRLVLAQALDRGPELVLELARGVEARWDPVPALGPEQACRIWAEDPGQASDRDRVLTLAAVRVREHDQVHVRLQAIWEIS